MKTHKTTFLRREDLGRRMPPYQPSFDFPGTFIDAAHQSLAEAPLKNGTLIQIRNRRWFGKVIPGWLRREDALKLYELAYFAAGDILELGSYHGLSTSILAQAVRHSKRPNHIYTADLSWRCVRATRLNLGWMRLHRHVTSIRGDAVTVVKSFAATGKRFGLVFIDHSHTYEAVYEVCRELAHITAPGGFCLFHDFNDVRNTEGADDKAYGVYQAVRNGLDTARFEFCGIYGCAALYRVVAN